MNLHDNLFARRLSSFEVSKNQKKIKAKVDL